MIKPVCTKCRKFLRPKKSGVCIEEGMPLGNADDAEWVPYKLWLADLWECPVCQYQIIFGSGVHPVAEHYQPDYAANVERFNPLLRVNDC